MGSSHRVTIGAWTDNAPIGKLVKLSKFMGISSDEIIHCLVEENSLAQSLHEKSESE